MKLRAVARNCLFLNWALPVASLPSPPKALRYEVHEAGTVFASALLFSHEFLDLRVAPRLPISCPQLQLRLCVLDGDDVPSVLVRAILIPRWALIGTRWWVRPSARSARFVLPPSPAHDDESRWSVECERGALRFTTTPAGPAVDGWRPLFDRLRRRPRGYVETRSGLRVLDTVLPAAEVWPQRVACDDVDLLPQMLSNRGEWPPLHSSWLCSEVGLVFDLGLGRAVALPRQLPAPG